MRDRWENFSIFVTIMACGVVLWGAFWYYKDVLLNQVPDNVVGIDIEKTKEGYNTYYKGQLQYEFTKQNTDSMSMETLKMIFEGE